nr:MAG TPA: hypothetical protein [Caudoviricetes sp.]
MKTEKEEIKKITLRELLEYTNEDEKVYIYEKDDEYVGGFRADRARKYLCESLLESTVNEIKTQAGDITIHVG